jgi:outer membrane biosynthesis protein TonB
METPRRTASQKKKKKGSNLPAVIGLVVGIHAVMGGGLYALTQTDAGQEFIRIHKIKFLEPEQEKQEEAKAPEPPPPPPKMEQQVEAPKMTEAPAPTASSPSVSIGGGGGTNWSGGKFIGGIEDGPMGAFHAGVLGRIRSCFGDWPGPANMAEVSLDVTSQGSVASYKLVRGTGSGSEDERLLEAIRCVQKKGVSAPPDGTGRVVTLRLRPSHGFASGQG